ncbi:sperm acrosome membrane-associated protein 4-like isoform X3 [Gadus macrocephalus]|uniref:sperm acrosome membrane-associated protein 4-like isoform X3 n=1 Tax=Gadus macrocephalus TaxID=80720 RepID=UPI0028CB732E|nr:sperm acrosome membrane-associated protein 4-like isoform X3 [Gadus macrocephalus]
MAAVWTRLLLLGVFVAVAHGLTCRRCPIAILGRCLVASDDVECDNSTRSCFTRTASFDGIGFFRPQSQGCVLTTSCGRTEAGTFLGFGFTGSSACCRTDLCNGGTSVQLSLAAAVVAVLASLWAR